MGRFIFGDRAVALTLDWLFPPRCAGCGALGQYWCDQCQLQVERLRKPLCPQCGIPLTSDEIKCPACSGIIFSFSAVCSWARYSGPLRQAILSLKHRKNETLGKMLAEGLRETLQSQNWEVDALVAMPLARQRLAKRGFNQVELLVKPLSAWMKIQQLPLALQRSRETDPQMDLSGDQRWTNVRGAFEAIPEKVEGRCILVVDDIMTTGATLDAAANALKAAGAKKVYGITLARTLLDGGYSFGKISKYKNEIHRRPG